MTTLPEPPRAALVDPRTGGLTREWTRFFDDLRKAIIAGLDEGVGNRLDRLELDALFSVDDGAGGASGAGYNDTTVRARLEALETELLWIGTDAAEAGAGQSSTDDGNLDAVLGPFPDPAGAIQRLTRAVADLELAQALATDASAKIAAFAYRLNALENENLFKR